MLLGGGIEFNAAVVKIAPEIRYARWEKGVFQKVVGNGFGDLSQPNQVEILLGIRF